MIKYIEIGVVILVMVLVGIVKYEHSRIVTLEADNTALHGAVAANQKFISLSAAATRVNDARTASHLTALENSHEADGPVAPVLAGTAERLRTPVAKKRGFIATSRGIHL